MKAETILALNAGLDVFLVNLKPPVVFLFLIITKLKSRMMDRNSVFNQVVLDFSKLDVRYYKTRVTSSSWLFTEILSISLSKIKLIL